MYCQISDIKESLNISGGSYDAQLNEYIATASDWIDNYSGFGSVSRAFGVSSETTRYLNRSHVRSKTLYTDEPFVSISAVVNADGATIPSDAYRLMPRNHPRFSQIHLLSTHNWSFVDIDSEIEITGKFGYSESIPSFVSEACRHFSGWLFRRWQQGLATSSATNELGTTEQITDVPGHVKTLLQIVIDERKMLLCR